MRVVARRALCLVLEEVEAIEPRHGCGVGSLSHFDAKTRETEKSDLVEERRREEEEKEKSERSFRSKLQSDHSLGRKLSRFLLRGNEWVSATCETTSFEESTGVYETYELSPPPRP